MEPDAKVMSADRATPFQLTFHPEIWAGGKRPTYYYFTAIGKVTRYPESTRDRLRVDCILVNQPEPEMSQRERHALMRAIRSALAEQYELRDPTRILYQLLLWKEAHD